LALALVLVAFTAFAKPPIPPPPQCPFVYVKEEATITGNFTLTQSFRYDYPPTVYTIPWVLGAGYNWSAYPGKIWLNKTAIGSYWLPTSLLINYSEAQFAEDVSLTAVNGSLHLVFEKIVDPYGTTAGEPNLLEKWSITWAASDFGYLDFTKEYMDSHLHAAVGVKGVKLKELSDTEEVKVYITTGACKLKSIDVYPYWSVEVWPGMYFDIDAHGKTKDAGSFIIGAIWYWQFEEGYPDIYHKFEHRQVVGGSTEFDISKTINMYSVTPGVAIPAAILAPAHPRPPL